MDTTIGHSKIFLNEEVKIMKKDIFSITRILTGAIVFSMLSFSQVSASTKNVTPVNSYRYVKQPTLNKVKVKYKNKKITITGQAKQIKKVKAVYGKTTKTASVKSDQFKIILKYKNEKDIKLYGLNSKNEKITKQKKVTSSAFVTAKPICHKITHTKKGITYELNTEAGSVVTAKYKGKIIKKTKVTTSDTRFFIAEKTIKGKKGKLIFTQKAPSKRTSKEVAYNILKMDHAEIVSH